MQLTRDQLLPRAALSNDEDPARNGCDAGNRLAQRTHGSAIADERGVTVDPGLQRSQLPDQPTARDRVFDLLDDALDRLRLVDETVRAKLHSLNAAVVASRCRYRR